MVTAGDQLKIAKLTSVLLDGEKLQQEKSKQREREVVCRFIKIL